MFWTTAWGGGTLDEAAVNKEVDGLPARVSLRAFSSIAGCLAALRRGGIEALLGALAAGETDAWLDRRALTLRLEIGRRMRLLLVADTRDQRLVVLGARPERASRAVVRARAAAALGLASPSIDAIGDLP